MFARKRPDVWGVFLKFHDFVCWEFRMSDITTVIRNVPCPLNHVDGSESHFWYVLSVGRFSPLGLGSSFLVPSAAFGGLPPQNRSRCKNISTFGTSFLEHFILFDRRGKNTQVSNSEEKRNIGSPGHETFPFSAEKTFAAHQICPGF